jgi:mannose-6-phosphate isomerase-like protein (cupin superfamily)
MTPLRTLGALESGDSPSYRPTWRCETTSELIDDPLFHQRYRFSRDGDVVRVKIWTEPGGGVLAEHVHPKLEERYEVLEGEVTFHLDRKPRRAGPGERLVVAAGVRHSFENTGEGIAHLVVEVDPALDLRESIEDGVRLGRAGLLTASGKPRGLRGLVEAAALAHHYRETVVLSSPPPVVQRLLFPLLSRLTANLRRCA